MNLAPAWNADSAGDSALVAVNAGQFARMLPWGWLVIDGRELAAPESGPLAMAVVFDSSGAVHFVSADSISAVRARGHLANAFQSYPALLTGDGEVPALLRSPSAVIDLAHRDSRVAIGEMRDGRLLIAVTRFNALGDAAAKIPFGLTIPEMSALMGALAAAARSRSTVEFRGSLRCASPAARCASGPHGGSFPWDCSCFHHSPALRAASAPADLQSLAALRREAHICHAFTLPRRC